MILWEVPLLSRLRRTRGAKATPSLLRGREKVTSEEQHSLVTWPLPTLIPLPSCPLPVLWLYNGDVGLGSGWSCTYQVLSTCYVWPGACCWLQSPRASPTLHPGTCVFTWAALLVVRLGIFHVFINNLSSLFMNCPVYGLRFTLPCLPLYLLTLFPCEAKWPEVSRLPHWFWI